MRLLKHIEEVHQCVLVAAAGNQGGPQAPSVRADDHLPGRFFKQNQLPNLLIVAATTIYGNRVSWSEIWRDGSQTGMVHAGGVQLNIPKWDSETLNLASGTSFAVPQVAALAGYLRSLDSKWKADLMKPANVVKMIKYLSRAIKSEPAPPLFVPVDALTIWNGHVGEENCLLAYADAVKDICDEVVKNIPDNLDNWNPTNKPPNFGPAGSGEGIEWEEGPSQPECTSDDCGTLCKGYYCEPQPTGVPPDFEDPINKVTLTSSRPSPKPSSSPKPLSSPSPAPSSAPRVSYDCEGGNMCPQANMKSCDAAANNLSRGRNGVNYGT